MPQCAKRQMTVTLCLMVGMAASGVGSGFAVMNRDVRVPAPGPAPFSRLQENQRLVCVHAWDEGYLVVCRDEQGQTRLAQMARRDEWGRATARLWTYDGSMESNTIAILVPVSLSSGYALFLEGDRYPVVESDDETLTLLYRFAEYEGAFQVSRTDARLEPPPEPETDPDKIREQQLQSVLRESSEQRTALETALSQARANAVRIQDLQRNIRLSDIENRRLRTELQETEHWVRQTLHETPGEDKALMLRQKDLDRLLREQAGSHAKHGAAQRETEALKTVERNIASVERDIMRIGQAVTQRQAELTALRATATDKGARQEQEDIARLVKLALAQQGAVAKDAAEVEALKNRLSPWIEHLVALSRENEALRQQLQTLRDELAALREKAAQANP